MAGEELVWEAAIQHTEAIISGPDLVWHYENTSQRSRACLKRRTGFLRKDTVSGLNKQTKKQHDFSSEGSSAIYNSNSEEK